MSENEKLEKEEDEKSEKEKQEDWIRILEVKLSPRGLSPFLSLLEVTCIQVEALFRLLLSLFLFFSFSGFFSLIRKNCILRSSR